MCHLTISFSFSKGGCPYPKQKGTQIAELLMQKYRMPKPEHVDEDL